MYISPEIVIGFHGCDKDTANHVINCGADLSCSENTYDWFGHGIYFWEGSYKRALEWAESSKKVKIPAVVGAFIKLGNCLDLLDSNYLPAVSKAYEILKTECENLNRPLPKNKLYINDISFIRQLDCKVISRLQQLTNEIIARELGLSERKEENKRKIQQHHKFIDSVRGMFPEGQELYKGAGFRDKNHIQLCIINPNCIIGYFNPKKQKYDFKRI